MNNLNDIYRTLAKLIKMPTQNAEELKDLAIDFDKIAEKMSKLNPRFKNDCCILLAKAFHKYGII